MSSSPIEELLGPQLFKKSKKSKNGGPLEPHTTASVVQNKDLVLLYFSAHWCPPCQSFTPILADFYVQHAQSDKFEIIYISSDRTEEEFMKYFTTKMPWYTLHPFHDEVSAAYKKKLAATFKIRGIPTLIVLDVKTGYFITNDARTDVLQAAPNKSYADMIRSWKAKPPVPVAEGLAAATAGDGTLWSMIQRLVITIAKNPMYLFASLYLIKQFVKHFVLQNNTPPTLLDASTAAPNSAHDPIPDDEF
jgi:nucleoredoxin